MVQLDAKAKIHSNVEVLQSSTDDALENALGTIAEEAKSSEIWN